MLLRRILKYSCVLTRRLDLGMECFISCYHWQTWVLPSSIAKHHGTSVYRWQQLQPLNPRSNLTPEKNMAVTGCHLRMRGKCNLRRLCVQFSHAQPGTQGFIALRATSFCSNGAACSTTPGWGLGFFSGALEEMAEVLVWHGKGSFRIKTIENPKDFLDHSPGLKVLKDSLV